MGSNFRFLKTRRAAERGTDCSLFISSLLTPASKLLQWSSLLETSIFYDSAYNCLSRYLSWSLSNGLMVLYFAATRLSSSSVLARIAHVSSGPCSLFGRPVPRTLRGLPALLQSWQPLRLTSS